MQTISIRTGWLKLLIGWAAVFLIRLLPFRPANFEPMLATMMPFATRFGYFASFLFGFLSIVLFDAVTSGIGVWTLVTAAAYGALGIGAHVYFKRREATTKNFLIYGVSGTVLYDIVTGLTTGPIFFNQPFMVAVVGQIPFTLMHVFGTVVFTLALSPVLQRWVVRNDTFEIPLVWSRAKAFARIS
ncbi:MAG: energy-coupling factor transport system substrate-specific component [Candidatus Parcubacteria bacterium]|jgi:uncharacterized membrane protein|nr:energy-coupling factor transport system substrate-specific component [Candidatus Parcubacteria bacterium]